MQLHAKLGYTAVAIYPLAPSTFLRNQRLPGGIKPEDWDGFHDLVVIDEIARCGYLGVVWGLSCGNAVGVPPLINFGSEEQKKRWLPGILGGGERWCLGITEPGGRFWSGSFGLMLCCCYPVLIPSNYVPLPPASLTQPYSRIRRCQHLHHRSPRR